MYNAYQSVASTSLSASGTIAEDVYPLWVHSSGTASTSSYNAAGQGFVVKGSTAIGTPTSDRLHTLNPNWATSQKFAFETSIYTSNASYPAYAALWDFTSNAVVSTSQVSTAGTTATLLRSGSFTLTPGHVYGVTIWNGATVYLTKAHLVALEM